MTHRTDYLDYAAITALLERWVSESPGVARLHSLATTPEGREVWCLTLGSEPDRIRPAIFVDGNMHASELAGSSVALAFAEDVLRVHRGERPYDLPPALLQVVRESLVYVVPRMAPDGAEHVLKTGAYVRSAPRDDRTARERAYWVSEDLDGDGLAMVMRVEDPTGELVESTEVPGLLVGRSLGDTGPFYKVYPEGRIAGFDGSHVPNPFFLSDNRADFNRNFPYQWMPEHRQVGAGAFPASEPEVHGVVAFTSAHPEIFCWVDFHTFGGVFIRPPGDTPDSAMNPGDLAIYRQIEAWATDLTGYPTVPGMEFVYEPETPLRGDLTDYAWHQRGAFTWVVELWDLFEQVGLAKTERFVDRYTHLDRADLEALARWDATHNQGRIVRPWRPFDHPQLGKVEIGGLDPRIGFWNPPPERLAEVCAAQVQVLLHAAALAPRLHAEARAEVRGGLTHVTVTVENRGYLPTHVCAHGTKLVHDEPVFVELIADGPCLGPTRIEVGHLDGWGRGRWEGSDALFFQRTRGTSGRRVVHFTLEGAAEAVRVGSSRVGWLRIPPVDGDPVR
ncbi:MAG: M14 family metallopeptidase [Myxococcota bacterium]